MINSTDIGTIFLDRSFRVVLFTPALRNVFNLISADYGRPLSDITNRLDHKSLLHDAERVLDKLTTSENEVYTTEGKVFLMRISPYRTTEERNQWGGDRLCRYHSKEGGGVAIAGNMEELTRFNRDMVSRETRMIELKKKLNALCRRVGEPPRYPLDFEQEENNKNAGTP